MRLFKHIFCMEKKRFCWANIIQPFILHHSLLNIHSSIYMPFIIRKLPNKPYYKVSNKITGAVHSKATSLANAKKQVRLLYMIDNQKV